MRRRSLVLFLMALASWNALAQTSDSDAVPGLRAVSEIKGLTFILYDSPLPQAPSTVQNSSECENYVVQPTSPAGKLVVSRGWAVTGEAPLGSYQAVSFAGRFEPGTSSHCEVEQGNIGIFKGAKLMALVYASRASKESIGTIAALEGGGLRVWDGDTVNMPVGDIQVEQDGLLRLGALAAEESFCHGTALVPNIYGLPIDKARKILVGKGWKPVASKPASHSDLSSREAGFVKHGIVEVDSCAGTGFAFCAFDYKRPEGWLSVTTVGEGEDADHDLPSIVGYGVKCHK